MLKNLNLNKNVIANKVKQSDEIATPCGLAMTGECGRSMVEMLGVLAVMGVLSVAGIAGYNSAMNKHRANELLNEASKRATVVAAQAMQGRETFSIGEFGTENSKLGFSETVTHDKTNGQFTLEIGGVSEAICQQMKNAMGPIIRKFEPATCADDATVKLTYNDDMSPTAKACDFASESECRGGGKTWCSGQGTNGACSDSSDCCAGFTENACQSCDTETGTITNLTDSCDLYGTADGFCYNGSCINCDNFSGTSTSNTGGVVAGTICRCASGYKWDSTNEKCVAATLNAACTTQDDCGGSNSTYFCKITNYTENGSCNNSNTSYFVEGRLSGTCQRVSSVSSNSNGGYTWTTTTSNWWSSDNWCRAQNKHLIDVDNLNCYKDGTATKITSGSSNSGYCCKGANGQCRSYWNDATNRGTYFSAKIVDIKEKVNTTGIYWAASPYGNSSQNSCRALRVDIYSGAVTDYYRHLGTYSALCE